MKNNTVPIGDEGPITTVCIGNSGDVIRDIVRLYIPEGGVVVDMNFGKGRFWRRVNPDTYQIIGVDIHPEVQSNTAAIDCVRGDNKWLPFKDGTFDAAVLDPPFGTGSTSPQTLSTAKTYNLKPFARYFDLIMEYESGIAEAKRALKDRGVLIVKCQDVINSGRFQPNHYTIKEEAHEQGFSIIMTYVLVNSRRPIMRHDYQRNPRVTHSYFQVFEKKESKRCF